MSYTTSSSSGVVENNAGAEAGFFALSLLLFVFYGGACVTINKLLLRRNDFIRLDAGARRVQQQQQRLARERRGGGQGSGKGVGFYGSTRSDGSGGPPSSGGLASSGFSVTNHRSHRGRKPHHHHSPAPAVGGVAGLSASTPTTMNSPNSLLSANQSHSGSESGVGSRHESPRRGAAAPGQLAGDDGDDTQLATHRAHHQGTRPLSVGRSNSLGGAPPQGSRREGKSPVLPIADEEEEALIVLLEGERLVDEQQHSAVDPKRFIRDHVIQMYLVALALCLYSLTLVTLFIISTPTAPLLESRQEKRLLIKTTVEEKRETEGVESDWVTLPMAALLYGFIACLLLTIYESLGVTARQRRRDALIVVGAISVYLVLSLLCLGFRVEEAAMYIDVVYSLVTCIICVVCAIRLPPQMKKAALYREAWNTEVALVFDAVLFLCRTIFFVPAVQSALLPHSIGNALPLLMLINGLPIVISIVVLRR